MVELIAFISFLVAQGRELVLERAGTARDTTDSRRALVARHLPEGEDGWMHLTYGSGTFKRITHDVNAELWREEGDLFLDFSSLHEEPEWAPEEQRERVKTVARETMAELERAHVFEALSHAARSTHALPPEGVPFGSLTTLRAIARACRARMALSAERGDWAEFEEMTAIVLMAGRTASHQGSILGYLVGEAVMALGVRGVMDALLMHDIPAAALDALAEEVERQRSLMMPLAVALEGERLVVSEILKEMHTDRGAGDGLIIIRKARQMHMFLFGEDHWIDDVPLANLSGLFLASRAELEAMLDKVYLDGIRMAGVERPRRDMQLFDERAIVEGLGWRHAVTRNVVLSQSGMILRLFETQDTMQVDVEGARLMLALERYERSHGEYPERLEALAPEYLDSLPRDPFSENNFVYRRFDAGADELGRGYLLYSVGADGRDDVGKGAEGFARRALFPGRAVGSDYVINVRGD